MTSENDTLADPSVLLNTWVQMETGWILEVIPGIDSDVNHISFRTEDGRYLRYVDGGFADLGEPSTVHRGSFILHTRPEGKYALKLSESADEFPGAYLWNNLVGQNRLYDTNWQAAQTPLNLSAYGGPTGTDISANNGGVVVGWWRMFPTGNLFNQPPTLSVANLQTDGGAGEMVMTPNFTDKVRVVREVPNNLRAMLIDNHEQPGPVALRAASVPAGAFSMAEGLTMSAWFAGETTISPTLELQNTDGAYIIPNDNPAFSGWGSTSRMSGDGLVAVVIASNASNVWILSRASTDDPFVETAVLLDPEPHLPGSFGVSDVSISHDGGIIVTTGPGRGHSYLFIRPESGNWAGGGDTRYVKLFLADKRVAVSADGGVVVTQSINNATHNLVFEPPINGGWVSAESTGVDYVRRLAMAPGVEHSTGSFKDMISNQLSLSGDGTTVALSQNWHVWVWQREAGVDSWAGSYDLVYASRLQHRLFGWLWVGYCKVGLSHDGSVLVTAAPSEDGELLESAYWNSYYYYPDAPLDYSGRLYFWERPSSTRWSVPDSGTTSIRENLVTRHETARLVAAYGQQGIGWHRDHTSIRSNHLGAELSINGDGNLIVAHGFSRNGVLRAKGYIYFWTKPTSGWGERGKVVDVVDRGVVGHLPDQPESYPSGYNSNGWNPGGGVYTGHLSLSHDGRHLFVSEGIGMGWRTGV